MVFHFPKIVESLPFYGNNENIDTALLSYTGTIDQIQFSLGLCSTYDGTYVWEEVTPTIVHSFDTTGVWIKWRAVGLNGEITGINIEVNV